MSKKNIQTNYVTTPVFNKEIKGLHKKIDGVEARLDKKIDDTANRLDKKIDNVAFAVVKLDERLQNVENTMATKSDINMVLERIDHGFKKMSIFDQEEGVQSLHLQEVRQRVDDHEKRLALLESAR